MSIIEVQSVSYSYPDSSARALNELSLSVQEGDFVGIVGPSGAGKSTLALALSGAIPHHFRGNFFGKILVSGMDTCTVALTDISKIVGSITQDINAQMVASIVEDELLFGLENFAVPHAEIPERITYALETVGIANLRFREIASLSGGQKQKVAIAALLALQPQVMVLDEPTAALDPTSSELIFQTLSELNKTKGITVVVIEQKVGLLAKYCSKIAVMDKGAICAYGSGEEVFSQVDLLQEVGVDVPRCVRVSKGVHELSHQVEYAHLLSEADQAACDETALSVLSAAKQLACCVGALQHRSISLTESPETPTSDDIELAGETYLPKIDGPVVAESSGPFDRIGVLQDVEQPSVQSVLDVIDATFKYQNSTDGVERVSLSLHPGELVALVGQNGAGKTTLTKLVNGLLRPRSGDIHIKGASCKDWKTSQIAQHVSTLFQNPDYQICKESVLEEIAFGLELKGASAEDARCKALEVIERMGLDAEASPFMLSRGQRQMVALASVVACEPDILVLDEPTSGLDYKECMQVMNMVTSLCEKGCAVLMVCHDMEVVLDFATRIVVMAHGSVLDDGEVTQIFSADEVLKEAYVEAPQMIQLSKLAGAHVDSSFAGLNSASEVLEALQHQFEIARIAATLNGKEAPRG